MFKKFSAVLLIVGMLFVIGCATHMHQVGNGAQGTDLIESRQWYVLWGLVPINEVDTQAMAGEATDYDIITEVNVLDAVINAFVGSATIYCRIVTVLK
jgi:hypothetical protein